MTSRQFKQTIRQQIAYCDKQCNSVIQSRNIPETGWSERLIEQLIDQLANADSNNRLDTTPIGAGEREGRIASPLVARLHLNMAHGIGRSGNLTEVQPKAQGSSMVMAIANSFAEKIVKQWGVPSAKHAIIVPMCTGMTLSLCMQSWRRSKPAAKYVIFSRIDQKSCFKSILTAGYEPIIVDPIRDEANPDQWITDVATIAIIIKDRPEQILAVLTTTSCFAPRGCDLIEEIAVICKQHDIYHLVNNAYGLQTSYCTEYIVKASLAGRVDAFVQSLDKNFMVPVGGSIIAGFKRSHIDAIAQFYPGRASLIPSRDFMITCLHLGREGLAELQRNRERCFRYLKTKLEAFAARIGERVYQMTRNEVSLAMTLTTIPKEKQTLFGGILFSRGITGARVVASTEKTTTIEGYEFTNWGSHSLVQHEGYINFACGVGMTEAEINALFVTLQTQHGRFIMKEIGGCQPTNGTHDREEEIPEPDPDAPIFHPQHWPNYRTSAAAAAANGRGKI